MTYLKRLYITGFSVLALASIAIIWASFTTASHTTTVQSETPPGQIVLVPLINAPARSTASAQTPTPAPTVTAEVTPETATPVPAPKTIASAPAQSKLAPKPAAPQVKAVASQVAPATVNCSGGLPEQFLCLLNQYRASKGKGKLSGSSALSKVAYGHSAWMTETGIFSHTGKDGSRLGDRCRLAGITCRAENLAEGIHTAQKLLDMWKASPSHNTNLLGGYTTAGLGVSGNYVTLLLN
jgi:uncharacterized protein YkwD